ncbi:MAG: Gx transporter family protein [Eubacterium sp.]|nr:Gx transporter family protein [Eubacterium sp.]
METTQRLTRLALYTTLALMMGYIESLIPLAPPIPGIKLGLPNAVVLLTLETLGIPSAFVLMLTRILLSAFLFGSMSSMLYALSGGLLSLLGMILLCKLKTRLSISLIAVSVVGALLHNLGQLTAAALVVQNPHLFLSYLPVLMAAAVITGTVTGIVVKLLIKYLTDLKKSH